MLPGGEVCSGGTVVVVVALWESRRSENKAVMSLLLAEEGAVPLLKRPPSSSNSLEIVDTSISISVVFANRGIGLWRLRAGGKPIPGLLPKELADSPAV